MFSKKVILIAMALVCICALATAVIVQAQNAPNRGAGQPPPPGPPGRPDQPRGYSDGPQCPVRMFGPPPQQMMARMADELKLDEQQRRQTVELVGALDAKIKEIVGDTTFVRDLVAEMKAEPTNAAKVNELAAKAGKQEAEILQAELAMWMRFEQVLTPEQRARFWSMFPMRGGQMGPGGPGGRQMPGPPGTPGTPRVPGPPNPNPAPPQ